MAPALTTGGVVQWVVVECSRVAQIECTRGACSGNRVDGPVAMALPHCSSTAQSGGRMTVEPADVAQRAQSDGHCSDATVTAEREQQAECGRVQ